MCDINQRFMLQQRSVFSPASASTKGVSLLFS